MKKDTMEKFNTKRPVYLSIREAADESGLSMSFWRHRILDGKIPFVKSGVKYLVAYDAAMEMINQEAAQAMMK